MVKYLENDNLFFGLQSLFILSTPQSTQNTFKCWQMDPQYFLTMWCIARLQYMLSIAIDECIESHWSWPVNKNEGNNKMMAS